MEAAIEYKRLVDDYNDSLVNVLRGFRPKYEFLELWVPDADAERSIRSLVEAARLSGEHKISLLLDKETAATLHLEELRQALSAEGIATIRQNGEELIVQVSNLGGRTAKELDRALYEVPPLYAKRLAETLEDIRHEGTIQEEDGLVAIRSNYAGVSLFVLVDRDNHKVVRATFAGTSDPIEEAILERLCCLIEGLPLQEISDHSVIKLEYELRDPTERPPIKGISNIFNMDKLFDLPKKLSRGLLEIYREKTGYRSVTNFFDEAPSRLWADLPEAERKKKVQASIDRFALRMGIEDVKIVASNIEKDIKVHVSFEPEIQAAEQARLMMQLEIELRKEVEKEIQLYVESSRDRNKIRRL